MKKKNLKNLSVNKSTISNLNKNGVIGGARLTRYYYQCGTGPQTIVCTEAGPECTYNSRERCKTNEVDYATRPIC
ncbi:class I lanthipeptide [Kordia algicida OT-1]|uniref:class I lanthipeptide n=1 Tax=Kordia algicida TaxID=221066 RepID=UPI003D9B15CF